MTAATAPATSYVTPRTIDEAVAAAAAHGATLVGGGTVLMALRAGGEVDPSGLVDLCGVEELGRVTATPDRILIGSTVTYASLLRTTDPMVPLLPHVCRTITGGPQIRVQGTLGGSACYANPASDMPAALVALGTSMLVDGPSGRRTVPAAEFFRGPFAPTSAPASC